MDEASEKLAKRGCIYVLDFKVIYSVSAII